MGRILRLGRLLPTVTIVLMFVAGCATVDDTTRASEEKRAIDSGNAANTSGQAVFSQQISRGQTPKRLWTVSCGLPQQGNPVLALLPAGGYTGPWFGDPCSGHFEVKTLNRAHPDGGVSSEMWLLSRSVGWWKLKAIRVHPDDLSKITGNGGEHRHQQIRQIIDSPFLSRPVIVRTGVPGDEEMVNGQILALLSDASQLRCAPRSKG